MNKKIIIILISFIIILSRNSVYSLTVDSYDTLIVIADVSESFSVLIERYTVSDNSGTTGDIYFGIMNFNDTWQLSNIYLKVTYFSNKPGWGMRTYVDNSDSINGANPYVAYSLVVDTSNYHAGLVGVTDTTHTLSMKAIVRGDTTAVPQYPSDDSTADANYGWKWLSDIESPNFDIDYSTLLNYNNAQDYGESVRVDFAINCKGALNQEYRTNTLYLEFYHE